MSAKKTVEIYNFARFLQEEFRRHSITFLNPKDRPELYRKMNEYYLLVFKQTKINFSNCTALLEANYFLLRLNKLEIMKRIELKSKLKDGFVAKIEGVWYSNKSPHLTNAICRKIYQVYGDRAFDVYEPDAYDSEVPEELKDEKFDEYFDIGKLKEREPVKIEPEVVEKLTIDENKTTLKLKVDPNFDSMTLKEIRAWAKENNIKVKGRTRQDVMNSIEK